MPQTDEPSPLSRTTIPSSFDSSPEFFEESRFQKLWRKLRQEPLIPLGCAATCYALYMASKSIRAGDHHQTNKMFRARIYAQGFTLVAVVAGSIFYKDERMRRKAFETAVEEKKAAEKREKWLAELEARDREDKEWRQSIERASELGRETLGDVKNTASQIVDQSRENMKVEYEAKEKTGEGEDAKKKKPAGFAFWNKSVKEEVTDMGWGPGTWVQRTREAWKRF